MPENRVKLTEMEKEIFKQCCALGCEMFKEALERIDEQLRKERDFKTYRNKGTRKTVMKTVMGEVEFRRTVYETRDEEGRKGFVYLFDEAIGRSGSGFFSSLLSEQIVQSVCQSSYRGAARAVSEMTGQSISHTAAWNVVQAVGENLDSVEKALGKATEKGNVETPVLFEEQDGIWLNLQGKDRKEYGKGKEMKLAIAYDGAKEVSKNRFELTNKVACANFEGVKKFFKRKESTIASVYNTDEIKMRLLNGDGAQWIRQSQTDETVHFQLDPFHRNKAVRTYVKDPKKQEVILELLFDERIDALLGCIEGYINCLDDTVKEESSEKESLQALLTYFTNNKDGLVPCHRRGLTIPPPPEGKVYRHMGTMESNIFTIIGNRMKGRRACWSIKGGNNLARLLCLKFTNRLCDTLQSLSSFVLSEKYAEEIPLKTSAKKIPLSEGKGYNGFKQMFIPSSMKWLKDLASQKPLA